MVCACVCFYLEFCELSIMTEADSVVKPIIRQMKYEEVEDSVKLFAKVGLYDSVSTIQAYYETDPKGFVVAVDEESDKIVGCCASPVTTHDTAFVGLYAVDPSYQKLGLGVKMFNKCMDNVGDRNCGLSAVPSKFSVYKDRAGFKVVEGRSMVVIQGKPLGISKLRSTNKLKSNYHLAKVTGAEHHEDLIKSIIVFDKTVHLDNREKLLRLTFAKPDTTTLAIVDSTCGKIVGYGCIRLDVCK